MALERVRFGPEVFRFQARGGVSRYVVELHRALLALGVDSGIEAGLHVSAMLDGVPHVRGRSVARWPAGRPRQALSLAVDRQVARRARRRLGPLDVWHPSYFDRVPPGRSVLAVTVYDMIHERFPAEVGPRDRTPRRKRDACLAADVVFCISRDTAADLHERFGIDLDRIVVTPLGVTVPAAEPVPPPFGDRPYLLYVGDRRPAYKNWAALLDALRALPEAIGLLCAGPPATTWDRAMVDERRLGARVRFASPTDGELAGCYRHAVALVYPSRYEGFGLPPLEALAQGCPVVATRVGAIPEVVGDLALLVEPTAEDLAGGVQAVLDGSPVVARQRSDGPAHTRRFSWRSTAEATLAGYERALAGRPRRGAGR